jgi:hypothetical protein
MSNGWDGRGRGSASGGAAFGVLLILVGVLFLAGQQLNIDWSQYGWPLFVIVPGLIMLVLGLAIPHEGGLGLAIPGGIVTTVGLILAFQDSTNTYASWSYAWALVAPGSVGASLFLFGLLHRRMDLVDAGLRTASVGLALFICFGLFFEVVIGLDEGTNNNVMRNALPFLAVAMGAIIVVINMLPQRRSDGAPPVVSDTWHDDNPSAPVPPAQG